MLMSWNEYEIYLLNMINLYRDYFNFSLEEIKDMFDASPKCNNRSLHSLRHKLYRLRNENKNTTITKDNFIPQQILNYIKKKPYSVVEFIDVFNLPEMFIDACVMYLEDSNMPIRVTDSGHVVYNSIKIETKENSKKKSTEYVSYPDKYKIKFGVVSDTHLGSSSYNEEALNKFYDRCVSENITTVLHAGDLVDGIKIYKGQEFEQDYYGFDSQTKFAIEKYPYREGIYTYAILGNHDYSFISHSDCDPLKKICDKRSDIIYLDRYFGEIVLGDFLIALHHPDSGCSYALSYKPQKILETLTETYDAYIIGHYHASLNLFNYHCVWSCLAGSFQNETNFARRKGLRTTIGGYIVEMERNEDGSTTVTPKWVQY